MNYLDEQIVEPVLKAIDAIEQRIRQLEPVAREAFSTDLNEGPCSEGSSTQWYWWSTERNIPLRGGGFSNKRYVRKAELAEAKRALEARKKRDLLVKQKELLEKTLIAS